MKTALICLTRAALLISCLAVLPAAADCGRERYFSPHDLANASPLKRPSRDFIELRNAAESGDAVAQRGLAVSYESGYLVERCAARALHWYRQAGKNGDRIARDWMDRHARLEQARQGPECAGAGCFEPGSGAGQSMSLIAEPDQHFHARVTVNGVSASGVIDTGASFVSMSTKQAGLMGISTAGSRKVTMWTANGSKQAQVVTVPSVAVGNITLRDVTVSVSDADMPLLVGMSFLGRLNIDMRGSSMTLTAR